MRKIFFITILIIACQNLRAQDLQQIRDSIVTEAKQLYRSEMASWYGTDIFLEKYSNKENIGGYLSYADGDLTRCIFFSKSEMPRVIGTMTFDQSLSVKSATADLSERDFNATENELYKIRLAAYNILNSRDEFFKYYKNTSLNVIPIIINGEKRAYVLTGTNQTGLVLFGNDYLLQFDSNNQLTNKRKFHNSLIEMKVEDQAGKKKVVGAVHNHLPQFSPFISATDICTLMLYSPMTPWETYVVVSGTYMSTWNCKSNSLAIIPMGK